jgi:hypothetical protein
MGVRHHPGTSADVVIAAVPLVDPQSSSGAELRAEECGQAVTLLTELAKSRTSRR